MSSRQTPHLVFMKTSTVEKIIHFQMIADELKLPIIFADARDFAGTQHTTDEFEGSVEGNANAKFEEYGNLPARLLRAGDPMHENAVALCKKYGMAFDPGHIHVAVDDFEWGIPKIGDRSLADTDGFKTYVGQDTLKRAAASPLFPGPELAPFISALSGNGNLLRGLKTGVRELQGPEAKTVESRVSVAFQYQTLDALEKPPTVLAGTSSLTVDLTKRIKNHFTVKDVACTKDGKSAADRQFLLKDHPRTQVVKAFAQAHGIEADPQWKRRIHTSEACKVTETVPTGSAVTASDPRKQGYVARTIARSRDGEPPDIVDMAAQFADRLRMADELLAQSDAVVFMPGPQGGAVQNAPSLDTNAIARQFMLSSAVVARQLNLRDAYKPFIVVNHKDKHGRGSYDRDFEIFDHLLHSGMMKDHTLGLERIKPEGIECDGVSYRRTLYFDLLEGSDLEQLNEARDKLLSHYRDTYYHPPALTMQDNADLGGKQKFREAVDQGKDIFKVAVFLSASSENLQLNEDTRRFGKWLAENEFGVVFGGGDRYLMGAVHKGYQQGMASGKRHFEAGFSTPEIVKSETRHGRLPDDMDVAILNKDIYERMGQMIALTDDAIIIRPGGPGTVQELAAVLLMKEAYGQIPEVARKKIIIQNPPLIDGQAPFYDPLLERLFGDKYPQLKKESQPGARRTLSDRLGIYIAQSDEQIKELLTDIRGDWQARQAARQSPDEPRSVSMR